MAAQDVSIRELVDKVARGELRLPELQRGFVWNAIKVRNLLDSLYRGYPSGTILTWETDDPVETRDFSIEQSRSADDRYQLLLDGQQRLTSLSAVLNGKAINVRDRKRKITLLFNLDHPEHVEDQAEMQMLDYDHETSFDVEDETEQQRNCDTFAIHTNKLARLPNWISVTDVLKSKSDAPILRKAGVTDLDDPNFERYSSRLEKLRNIVNYQYRVDVLDRSKSYEEVTDIFVRVNSSGTILRGSDLALAQITARWRGSLSYFLDFADSVKKKDYDLGMAVYLKVLVAMVTGQSRFRHIDKAATKDLEAGWSRAKQGIDFAINFLKANVDIDSPILLSSPYIIIALAVYGDHCNYKISSLESAKLRKWALTASAKGRYSGTSEDTLNQDIVEIRGRRGTDGMIQRLRSQFVGLKIEPVELEHTTSRSPLYRSMFLAFRDSKAEDWDDGLVISVNHAGAKHRIESHHIFPKDLLEGKHPKPEVNNIANLAFVSSRKNKRLGKTPPEEYLGDIDSRQLKAQCIPTDPSLWPEARYLDFLEERRRLIAKRLNDFIGMEAG